METLPSRTIVHLDADAFFASCEQAADASLRGKPVAVGGSTRGIIASPSYEARKYGVKTAMPTAKARKLCPKLIVIPGDYERYEWFSERMFNYCREFTPDVEETGIDEGFFDLTANRSKSAADIAELVRKTITQTLKITVSEGIGSNKLVSAVASKLGKPSAFREIPRGGECDFLHPLPTEWLPGIGEKTGKRLALAGLVLIKHVAGLPLDRLSLLLGSQAVSIREFAHGIDNRPLIPKRERQKTFSQQETFGADITDEEYVEAILRRMADKLFADVRSEGRTVRTLNVRVRYNDFDENQVSESLNEPTDLETDIYGRLRCMLRSAWKRRVSLRLVSLKLSNLYDGRFRSELPLDVPTQRQDARVNLAGVVDELRRVHGREVILRGHDFRLRLPPREAIEEPKLKVAAPRRALPSRPSPVTTFVPLRMHSHYSFLDSLLSPAALVELAARHRLPAVALTDTGNLHGAVEFVQAAQSAGVKPIVGAEVPVVNGTLLLYAESGRGYHNLCRLLSHHAERTRSADESSVATQQRRAFHLSELDGFTEGLLAVGDDARFAELFPRRFYRLVTSPRPANDFPMVAAPAVRYAAPGDRLKYDIVQSIRTLTLLRETHPEKRAEGRFHFRAPSELIPACAAQPEWLLNTLEIAERCQFDFPFGPPQFPDFHPPDGSTAHEFLYRLVMEGLQRRYRNRAAEFAPQVAEELNIIAAVGYESYFLMVWSILQDCRARGIEWITRGSAADSLVCYCLEISGVCPVRFDLYFKRFLNPERMALNKLPDIDIDFPHDRKDDVVKLIFDRYGKETCAVVGGFSTFQARSAFAECAKVLGVSDRDVRRFTEHFPWGFGGGWVPDEVAPTTGQGLIELLKAAPETRGLPFDEEPYRTALQLATILDGRPRYPKMHPCGVVLSCQPMHELAPTFISNKGMPTTHYDMDAVEVIGLVKMDILAQGGLAAMRDAKDALARRGVVVDLDALEPWDDSEVWEMIASGGARAVHHIESPAMINLCRMTNVREIDGLVAIVSVIRPGAANESKKLSFTRRYQGMETTTYPHPSLEPCLRSTFGLVVYEEHILQICEAFAGLPAGRADVLRRALVKQKRKVVQEISVEFGACARKQGHDEAKIKEVWELVTGFSGYAFNKAHSTAYGVEAYQTAWLKRYHPAEFMAGVLSNGKGFYHPLVYVLECHRLGLSFLPPSVNEPGPAFVPHGTAIRVPVTEVKGLGQRTKDSLVVAWRERPFTSLTDFFHRVAPTGDELEAMIRAGAFDMFGDTRTRQFWQKQHLLKTFAGSAEPGQAWLLPPVGLEDLPGVVLQEPTRVQRLQWETELFGYAVSGHPLELFPGIAWDTYCPVNRLGDFIGETVVTCGLVVEQRTHHQITGEPMKFMSIADRTGIVETEMFADTYRNYALATVSYPVLEVTATVEPFENGRGFSLRILKAAEPRKK
jgi:DNA-directed DNA polymerase III PolC